MPIDPTLLGLGSGLLQGIGGAFGSAEERRRLAEQLAEQRRQFNVGSERDYELGQRNAAVGEGQFANQLGRQMQTAPLRDRAAAALTARMGYSPQAFAANDIFNPLPAGQAPSGGGIDLAGLQRQVAGYQPGQGGQLDTSLQQAILGQLGYGQNPQGGGYQSTRPPVQSSQDALSQIGMPAPQYIQQLARSGNLDALRSIAETGQGPSTQPGQGMHRYNAQEQELARLLLGQISQGRDPTATVGSLPQGRGPLTNTYARAFGGGG